MATRLNWEYQNNGEQHAMHNGYRIRAVIDQSPGNPIEDWDCNWPIAVMSPDTGYKFVSYPEGDRIEDPLVRFTDEQLVFNQVHIAKALGFDYVGPMLEQYESECEHIHTRWTTDASLLRDAADLAFVEHDNSGFLDICAQLYALLDIPTWCGTVHGYSQGDWADVLVVGSPEATFSNTAPPTADDLKATADLYAAWAFGDVYGYIVEKPLGCAMHLLADDPDEWAEVEWMEVDSCWSFYGSDFEVSGLEASAMARVPELEVA